MKKFSKLMMLVLALGCLTATSCNTDSNSNGSGNIVTQARTITGVVRDDVSTLENVEVSIRSTSYKVNTDAEGKFKIELSEEDSNYPQYTLVASKVGYLDMTKTLQESEFNNYLANIDITLLSEELTINGVVKNDNAPIEGVKVKVSSDNSETTTDAEGKYLIKVSRPIEAFTVTFSKNFYTTKVVEVNEYDVSTYQLNVDLESADYSVSGTVSHYFNGVVEGATVKVKGTDFVTTSDSEGKFSLERIKNVNLPYTLQVSKEGYETSECKVEDANVSDLNLEIIAGRIDLGVISPSGMAFNTYITRDSRGLYFYLESEKQFVAPGKLCMYVDVNETSKLLGGSTVIELAFDHNDRGDLVFVVWNHKTNLMVDPQSISWGSEVIYDVNNSETGTKLFAFVSYSTFGKAGADFAITKDSVVGITFFERTPGATGALGRDRADLPGTDAMAWVNSDFPTDYVRFAPENVIYQAPNNDYVPYGTYTISFTVKDEANQPVEGVNVKLTSPVVFEQQTDAEGKISFALFGVNFAAVAKFDITCSGYVQQEFTVTRDLYVDKFASINLTIVKAETSIVADTGYIVDFNGPLAGATVSIKGFDGKVITDENGLYDLTSLNIDLAGATSYTLVVAKEGYTTAETNILVGCPALPIYLKTTGDLGVFGSYLWNTHIARDDTKVTFDLTSPIIWHNAEGHTSNNELQFYFLKDVTAKTKTADNAFELTIWEDGANYFSGWRDGARDFINPFPSNIVFSVNNTVTGCHVHVEVPFSLIGISADALFGIAFGEWNGTAGVDLPFSGAFFDNSISGFTTGGWFVNPNEPYNCIKWESDGSIYVNVKPNN